MIEIAPSALEVLDRLSAGILRSMSGVSFFSAEHLVPLREHALPCGILLGNAARAASEGRVSPDVVDELRGFGVEVYGNNLRIDVSAGAPAHRLYAGMGLLRDIADLRRDATEIQFIEDEAGAKVYAWYPLEL